MSLLDPLKDFHANVVKAIQAGESGLARIVIRDQPISISHREHRRDIFGTVPDKMTVKDVRGAIIDDLVDKENDNGAMASKSGVFTKEDFEERAEFYEERFLLVPLKDQRFAKAIREFAETWPS